MGKVSNRKNNNNVHYGKDNKNKMNENENQNTENYYRQENNNSMAINDTPPRDENPENNLLNKHEDLSTKAALATVESNIKSDLKSSFKNELLPLIKDVQSTKNTVGEIGKNLSYVAKSTDINNVVSSVNNAIFNVRQQIINQSTENISIKLNGITKYLKDAEGKSVTEYAKNILKSQHNSTEKISSHFTDFEGQLKTISENTEMIQSLPGKLDTVTKILEDKGLQLKQELPAINHDEETIAELAECGEKILQQLATAARWYARKLPEINSHDKKIEELNKANEKLVEKAANEGEQRGRKAVIAELLGLYDNIQMLMNPTAENAQEQLQILATFLQNKGVEPIYKLNEEIEITPDNLMNYQAYFENLNPGKIVITSPAYTFDSKIVKKASYIPSEEFYKQEQNQENISQEQNQENISQEQNQENISQEQNQENISQEQNQENI